MPTTAGLRAHLCAQLCKAQPEDCLLYLFYKLRVSTSWINPHDFSSLQRKLEYSNLSYHPCPTSSDKIKVRNASLLWMQSYPRSTRNVSLHTLGFRLGLNLWGGMVEIIGLCTHHQQTWVSDDYCINVWKGQWFCTLICQCLHSEVGWGNVIKPASKLYGKKE